jgi:hypothetical protein
VRARLDHEEISHHALAAVRTCGCTLG